MDTVRSDVRSTTGSNIRYVILNAGLAILGGEPVKGVTDVPYLTFPETDCWPVPAVTELLDVWDRGVTTGKRARRD